jgi:hypothetical protein
MTRVVVEFKFLVESDSKDHAPERLFPGQILGAAPSGDLCHRLFHPREPRWRWRGPARGAKLLALSSILVFFTTFLAAGLAVLIGWFALSAWAPRRLAEDLSDHLLDESPPLLKDDSYSTISPWARLLEKSDFVRIMHRHLQQAGLTWSVGRVTLLMLLASSVALGIAMQFEWIPGWAIC